MSHNLEEGGMGDAFNAISLFLLELIKMGESFFLFSTHDIPLGKLQHSEFSDLFLSCFATAFRLFVLTFHHSHSLFLS